MACCDMTLGVLLAMWGHTDYVLLAIVTVVSCTILTDYSCSVASKVEPNAIGGY